MVQTPHLVTGQVVKQAETDLIIAAVRAWSQLVKDLLLAQLNAVIPGGFALSAATGAPIAINYAQGVVILAGYDIAVPAGTLALAAADPNYHRYDLLTIAYSQTTPSDSAGAPTTLDTATPTVVEGTASSTPVLPALPAGSVQLGWVDVPPGVTTASQCAIYTAPGPLVPNNLQDLTNHLAAVFSTVSGLHGYLVTSPGGTGTGRLLVGDNTAGAAGAALTVVDSAGVAHPAAQSGQHPLGYLAVYDTSTGRVEDSKLLGGLGPSAFDAAGAAQAVQTALGSHESANLFSATGVHGVKEAMGDTGLVTVNNGNGGVVTIPVSFGFSFAAVPNIQLTVYTAGQIGIQYGYDLSFFGRTTSGFTIQLGQVTGSNQQMGVCWRAVGN